MADIVRLKFTNTLYRVSSYVTIKNSQILDVFSGFTYICLLKLRI